MPASYRIDAENSIVYSRGWGALTDDQIQAHARALKADARFVGSPGTELEFAL